MRARPMRMRLDEACGLARSIAERALTLGRKSDAIEWSRRCFDLLTAFVDRGELADLQGAAGVALAALIVAIERAHGVPAAEIDRVGAILSAEAIEIIDRELQRLDAAIEVAPPGAARKVLLNRRANIRAERRRIRQAAPGAKIESEANS